VIGTHRARAVQTGLPRAIAAVFRKNTRGWPHVPPSRLSTFCLSVATRTSNPPAFITLYAPDRELTYRAIDVDVSDHPAIGGIVHEVIEGNDLALVLDEQLLDKLSDGDCSMAGRTSNFSPLKSSKRPAQLAAIRWESRPRRPVVGLPPSHRLLPLLRVSFPRYRRS
jgi:hypothetical protein